jgi:CBS domain containing-hemolysin-like protein
MKKWMFVLTVLFASLIQYYLLNGYSITGDLLNGVITFLSIIFGFYIASLAIFVSSRYVSELYSITDKDNKNLTLLHRLIKNYEFGLTMILISIAYFLIVQLLISQSEKKSMLLAENPLFAVFLPMLCLNFLYSYRMLKDLLNVIIQEAKRNGK